MRKIILILMATLMLSFGCASKYGEQITDVNYYPNCYSPIGELRAEEASVQSGTGAGISAGAVMGALIGYAATGDAGGAVAGAAVGAVVGGVAGYGLASHQAEANAEVRLANYAQAVNMDVSEMDAVTASASQARECYEAAFDTARKDFKSNRISSVEFDSRYKEIRSGLLESASILKDFSSNMTARDKEYRDTLAWEAEQRAMPTPDPKVYAAKSKPKRGVKASKDPELDSMARENAKLLNSQAALDQERASTESAITVFDQNAHDLMGIDA